MCRGQPSKEGDRCLRRCSAGSLRTPLSQHPLPSRQRLELELQTSAHLFLSHHVYLLPPRTPQPPSSTPLRTVNGESQPCPFRGHKWRRKPSHHWRLPREKPSAAKRPVSSVTEGCVNPKAGNTTTGPLKKGASVIRTWLGTNKATDLWQSSGKPQERFPFFETTKTEFKFSLGLCNCEYDKEEYRIALDKKEESNDTFYGLIL